MFPVLGSSQGDANELQGSVYLITGDDTMLRLPIPSRSPRDPLNWTALKRTWALVALLFYSIVGLLVVQGPSIMYAALMQEFTPEDTNPFNVTILLSAPTLFMGIGAFLWIPLTLVAGRRPMFLVAAIVLFLSTVSAGVSRTFQELLASVSFQGLAEGFSTSAILLMAIDLTFIHQRPKIIGMLWSIGGAFSLTGLAIIPLIPDVVDTHWRRFYRYWSILMGISFILAFFLYPETYFRRPAVAFNGRILVQNSEEKLHMYEGWEETPGGRVLPDKPGRSFLGIPISEMKFWGSTGGGVRALKACYSQIMFCMLNPLLFWIAILEALIFGSMLFIGETYALVLTMPPYSIPIKRVALVNMAGAFGSFLAWPATGLFIPWITRQLTIRNGGVRDAEHYLPAFIMPVLAGTVSVILYGITVEREWSASLVYISYALNGFSFATLATANTLWVCEAFPRWTAPGLVVVGGASYMASFGMSFAILPWIQLQGYAAVGIEIGIMIMVVGCISIPVAFWGKTLRQYIHGKWAWSQEGALRPQ